MKHLTNLNGQKNDGLDLKNSLIPADPIQGRLDLKVETYKEKDGVGMGVLSDGTAYLTARGLAKLCGVDHTIILDIGSTWPERLQSPRVTKIKELLYRHGSPVNDEAYIQIVENNVAIHAYPDYVCMAVLEYYAFEAGQNIKQVALKNYRRLAGSALKAYIYSEVGYDPNQESNRWIPFLERLSVTSGAVPVGYFGIFKETHELAVSLGEVGLYVNQGLIHDISVGRNWSNHWCDNKLDSKYGERIKYYHKYPESFSQFFSNPQEAFAYPEASLPEFRRWLREDYVNGGKLKSYLSNKAKQQNLPPTIVDKAIQNYNTRFLLDKI